MNKRSMVISIIGRPNVGKSSIFNRLMKRDKKAITFDQPGVTRDRHYAIATFDDIAEVDEKDAILVDTGGFYPEQIDDLHPDATQEAINANHFFNIMTDHAKQAIEESDLILFVVDVREGIIPFDQSIAEYLRTTKKPFWVIINKYDSDKQAGEEAEFYSLGLDTDEMFVTSAAHGLGIDDLRRRIHGSLLDFEKKESQGPDLQLGVTPREQVVCRVALIGAPNVGKSTLLNCLIGANRALVSDIPGTTVDPIEGFFDIYFGKDALKLDETVTNYSKNEMLLEEYEKFRKNNPNVYAALENAYSNITGPEEAISEDFIEEDNSIKSEELCAKAFDDTSEETQEEEKTGSFWRSIHIVDTAGIRRKKSVEGFIESQSVFRSLRCISEADVIVHMIDATKGIGHQDRRLMDIALEKGKSVIVCVNKMDLVREKVKTQKDKMEWIQDLRDTIPWLDFCDLVTISAKHSKSIRSLKNSIKKTILVRKSTIPTGHLNRVVLDLVEKNPIIPKKSGGKRLKVKYASMVKTNPPTFLFFANKSKGIPDNYRRYLQNGIRKEFLLYNSPVHLIFRTGTELKK
jgi:GTP-binding protein